MAMRNIMLQLGMLQAIVAMSKATDDGTKVSLRQTHKCLKEGKLVPIKQQRICPIHGEVVTDIVSAYEVAKDQFLEITDADKASIKVPSNGALIIQEICKPEAILSRPILFTGQSYFLTPPAKEKFPPTAFTVIREALKGDVAIARTSMYDREYTCLIRVGQHGLCMDLIRYPGELRSEPEVRLPAVDPSYVTMTRKVLDAMRVQEPKLDYPDNYNEGFAKMVEAKVAGQPQAAPTQAPQPVQVDNLKAMLEAMLAAQGQTATEQPAEQKAEAPKAKKGRKAKVA